MADYFEHHPAAPIEIAGVAARLFRSGRDTHATLQDVEGGAVRAADAVDGDLTPPLTTAHVPAVHAGSNVAQTAHFTGGAMLLFTQAVTTYNAGIDRLNAQVPEGTADGTERLRELRAEQARLGADLDGATAHVASMLRRGPNAADLAFLRGNGVLPPDQNGPLPLAMPVFGPNGPKFRLGGPSKPGPTPYSEDFPYDPNADPTIGDEWSWWSWGRALDGGWPLRPDLDDALPFYKHHRDATGTPMTFDYEEAYNEDAVIREGVGGNKVTMTVTVHAEDRYGTRSDEPE